MHALEIIAEQKIAAALAAGDLEHLPGAGEPLDLDDDRLVPEELRMAYRILKNAGFVPPELDARREAASLRRLLTTAVDEDEKRSAAAKLTLIEARIELAGRGLPPGDYRDRIAAKLGRR